MMNHQHLLHLLSDATVSATGWQNFLNGFLEHFELHCCHLYIFDQQRMVPRFQEWSGTPPTPQALEEYLNRYIHQDPVQQFVIAGEVEKFHATNLLMRPEEYEHTDIYQQWLKPQGIHWACACPLFRDERWICVLFHNRHKSGKPYQDSDIEQMNKLTPFIAKAMKLRIAIAEMQQNSTLMKSITERLAFPAAILNEFGELAAINSEMSDFLERSSTLTLADKHYLMHSDPALNAQLGQVITETIASNKNQSLTYPIRQLPLKNNLDQQPILFEPLFEKDESTGNTFIGAWMYIFPSSDFHKEISTTKLKEIFGLTNSEIRVCKQLLAGFSANKIAEQQNKSIHTVREQLQACIKKTNTKSQLELINFLRALPNTGA